MQLYGIEPLNDWELRVEQQLHFVDLRYWRRFNLIDTIQSDYVLSALRGNNDSHFWNQAVLVAYRDITPSPMVVILAINAENLVCFAFTWMYPSPRHLHELQTLTMDTILPIVNNRQLRRMIDLEGYVDSSLTSPTRWRNEEVEEVD